MSAQTNRKVIKMEEVDWSKAPSGATHCNVKCGYPWLKETPISYFVHGDWVEYCASSYKHGMTHLKNAVKRPQEWDGGGIPPVGTECEYLKDAKYRKTWIKVKVVFIGSNLIVFEHGANGNEFSEQINEVSFRPINTPEQIAAEERMNAIDEMVYLSQRAGGKFNEMMSALYDAGYRKTEV